MEGANGLRKISPWFSTPVSHVRTQDRCGRRVWSLPRSLPSPPLLLCFCLLPERKHLLLCHLALTRAPGSPAHTATATLPVCGGERRLRRAALRCMLFFSWPHACSMFEHALHAGHSSRGARAHTHLLPSVCPLSGYLAPPPLRLRAPAMEAPSLWLLLLLLISSPSTSVALLSPQGINYEGSFPPLSLFLSLVFVLVFFFTA
jgi:hypothetical protein